MSVGTEELQSTIRTIDSFDDILPIKGYQFESGDKLISIAKGYGLNDMHDVIADYIDLGKNTVLREVKDSQGKIVSYAPEIKINVNFKNALEVQRKLSATMVLLYTGYLNDKFQTHWEHSFEPKGIFGATWSNGFATIERIGTRDSCLELISTYTDKLKEVQNFHSKQLDAFGEIVKIVKGSKDKK